MKCKMASWAMNKSRLQQEDIAVCIFCKPVTSQVTCLTYNYEAYGFYNFYWHWLYTAVVRTTEANSNLPAWASRLGPAPCVTCCAQFSLWPLFGHHWTLITSVALPGVSNFQGKTGKINGKLRPKAVNILTFHLHWMNGVHDLFADENS